MGYSRFFFTQTALYPNQCNKKTVFITKNLVNFYSLQVTKFPGDSIKNEIARTKKLEGGGGASNACLGLNDILFRVKYF